MSLVESSLAAAAKRYGHDFHLAYHRAIKLLPKDAALLKEIAQKIVSDSNPGLVVMILGTPNDRDREAYRREYLRSSPRLRLVHDAGDYAFDGRPPDFADDEAEVFRDSMRD